MKLVCALLIYRIILGIIVRNYEYPDQFWQGPQIAHYIHYGFGYLTWEWTLDQPLRNPVYPWILSLPYYIFQAFSPFLNQYLVYGPQIMQILLSIIGDFYLIQLITYFYPSQAKKYSYGNKNINWGIIFILGSSFGYTTMLVRTYFNSFECILFIIGYYYWVKGKNKEIVYHHKFITADLLSRCFAILGYISRPTSLIIWAIIWPYQLFSIYLSSQYKFNRQKFTKCLQFIIKNIFTVILMILSSLLVGTIYYDKKGFTLTQLNFFKYNFILKWSHFYGQQSSWFYLIISFPFLMGFSAFLFLSAVYKISTASIILSNDERSISYYYQKSSQKIYQSFPIKYRELKVLTIVCVAYLLISSLSVHKQHRFILPIVPFLLIISYYSLVSLSDKLKKKLILLAIIVNVIMVFSLSFYGKNGSFQILCEVRSRITQLQANSTFDANENSLIYMAEGHGLPGIAYVHHNISLIVPDSSPLKKIEGKDQNILLKKDPINLFHLMTKNMTQLPAWIISQHKYETQDTNFLFKNLGYHIIMTKRYCTIFQEIFLGYDSLILYEYSMLQGKEKLQKKKIGRKIEPKGQNL